MKKTFLISGIIVSTMFLSACTMPYRLYQQKPPANLNNGSQVAPPGDVGVPDTVESVEEVINGTYIENIECGYLSIDPKPENGVLYLVSDEADLAAAETVLGMKVPDNAEWPWDYETAHVEAFQEMKNNYPIEQYSYLFLYQEYSSLGYHSHSDDVVIRNGNELIFHFDEVKSPGEGEAVCEAMDGEFKIAAIPRSALLARSICNVVRPSDLVEEVEDE